ncbi:putative NAD(P)-binding protein [Kushneria sinocarnis]|uniref:Putative NAD(P)-binding protein n=1 Tax=Kushneria sinocarnis TaxID=595502 RepID=A0A420WUF0_9GAMM|nr:SDR family oxidoreductase [Kushneria sinocarnis]RKQ97068.1 putative NAD(P)-binding protein [Kushneria sinocarnis]
MTTLIIGANGQIGRRLCQQCAAAHVPVRAMIRHENQRAFFEELGIETVRGDLGGDMTAVFTGCDQVVFTAGSGASTGPEQTLMIDLNGAMRAIDLAREQGVERFIMVSTRHTDPLQGPERLRPYLAAKRAADAYLTHSGLAHVILRPGRLTDAPGSGRIALSREEASGEDVSRDNVARVIVTLLKRQQLDHREFVLLDGERVIDEAIR